MLIQQLRRDGISGLHLISGDSATAVAHTANQLNLTHAHGNMLPQEKCAFMDRLVAEKQKVAMVGDGINDAPALAEVYN